MNKIFAIDHLKIQTTASIEDAISTIDQSGSFACALIYDGERFINIVTDGDIRRAILSGHSLTTNLNELLLCKSQSSRPLPIVAKEDSPYYHLEDLIREHSLRQLVLVDASGQPCAILDCLSGGLIPQNVGHNFVAMIMAGGYGTRLRPLTIDTPKPMLPIGGRPLLEILIEKLVNFGASHIYITTHYLADKIISHFGNGEKFGVDISYVHEDSPLGTGGALTCIAPPNANLLVINGDILTELNIAHFLGEHIRKGSMMSIATNKYSFQVPFGVLKQKNGRVIKIDEKPEFHFLINSGIYFLSPEAFKWLPLYRQVMTMPQFAEKLMSHGLDVACFPIFEKWLDIGQINDYMTASEQFTK